MQFQVPQNLDLEDKIVGPMTLTQFLYVLGGGLVDYLLFQTLARDYFALFLLFGIPIALLALGLAFFKVQEQPLTHFISCAIIYFTRPKLRIWQRIDIFKPILTAPPKKEKKEEEPKEKRHLEKSELEQLAYNLDTAAPDKPEEKKKFGSVTTAFEQLLKEQPSKSKAESKK
jgi:hypothetical protein